MRSGKVIRFVKGHNVEVTGAARLYRAASVWTAELDLSMNAMIITEKLGAGDATAPQEISTANLLRPLGQHSRTYCGDWLHAGSL